MVVESASDSTAVAPARNQIFNDIALLLGQKIQPTEPRPARTDYGRSRPPKLVEGV